MSEKNDDLKRKPFAWSWVLVILALGLFTNCYLLGNGPLAGTEGHRALASHQMVTTGQWLIPHLFDQVYLRKPPLQYWIAGALEEITGRADPFIWRLPSAVSGALTAVVLYLMTARWYGRLAGWVAGVSCCGLMTLWGQNRTAEIDALNTTACVLCTCLLLDIGWGKHRGKLWPTLGAAAAFGAAMMTKGPAGIAPIIGALLGPAIFNRTTRALKSPLPWIALGLGCLPLGVYALAVYLQFHAQHVPPDTSGLLEFLENFLADRIKNIPDSLYLGPNLFLYTQPVSIFLLLAFHPSLWREPATNSPSPHTQGEGRGEGSSPDAISQPNDAQPGPVVDYRGTRKERVGDGYLNWSDGDRQLLRGLMGVLLVSLIVTLIFGLVHPRYSYLWLPMICPIAGAVAAGWERRVLPEIWRNHFLEIAGYAAIVLAVGAVVLTLLSIKQHAPMRWTAIIAAATAILVCCVTLVALAKYRLPAAGWGFIVLILLIGVIYGPWGITDRQRRATTAGSEYLASHFPRGTTFTTGDLIFEQPELFYYAGMNVESYPDSFLRPMDLPTSRWLVMEPTELANWKSRIPDRLMGAKNINPVGPEVWLVWYVAKEGG